MSTGVKKLQEEYKFIRKSGILATVGGSCCPVNKTDFLHWYGCILGPKNTPYAGGTYYFEMKFTNEYPNKGPIDVRMKTPTYHPNINSSNGHICVQYFSGWKNTNDVAGIVTTIFDLLNNPNPASSYNSTDTSKSADFNRRYANENQKFDWNNSWDKGWIN
jgi:ubiquitin-protein ligase